MLPSRSNTPAERSPASRTEVENAVRTKVCACSSTTAISRDHMICIWICDSASFGRIGIAFILYGYGIGFALPGNPTQTALPSHQPRSEPKLSELPRSQRQASLVSDQLIR